MCLSVVAFFLLLFLFSLYHGTWGVLADQHREPATQLSSIGFYPELCFLCRLLRVFVQIVPSQSRPTDSSFLSRLWVLKFESSQATESLSTSSCAHTEYQSAFPVSIHAVSWRAVNNPVAPGPPPAKKMRLPRQIILVAWAVSRKPSKTCSMPKSTLRALQDC